MTREGRFMYGLPEDGRMREKFHPRKRRSSNAGSGRFLGFSTIRKVLR